MAAVAAQQLRRLIEIFVQFAPFKQELKGGICGPSLHYSTGMLSEKDFRPYFRATHATHGRTCPAWKYLPDRRRGQALVRTYPLCIDSRCANCLQPRVPDLWGACVIQGMRHAPRSGELSPYSIIQTARMWRVRVCEPGWRPGFGRAFSI